MMALAGTRVVDLSTGIAGPLAGMLLGDFGAEVVKVEPPGGDPARRLPGFAVWNRNKQSVVVDRGTPEGRRRLGAMLAGADLCLVSEAPERLGGSPLEPARVAAANPALVYVHLPPFAPTLTPWAGAGESAGLLHAAGGLSLRQSSFEGGPIDFVYPHALYLQGIWAAAAGVAALVERERSGLGQVVTVAGIHGIFVAMASAMIDPSAPEPTSAVGPAGRHPAYAPYRCGDGRWLMLAALSAKFQAAAFDVLGVGDILNDPRIGGDSAHLLLPENRDWVRRRVAAAFLARDRDEWLALLDRAGCPAGPLGDRDAWLDHPQIRALGMRAEVDDPERGRVVMPGIPLGLSATPGAIRSPAPRLDEHAADAGRWPARPRPSRVAAGERQGPLAGYRVLDLGAVVAGPYAGFLLAELGAEVIKVEPPSGDFFRVSGANFNRGQRGLAIDLARPAGRAALYRLVARADAVIDNYRPGVLQRLGMDYETLARVNPRIVTMTVTGFGESGPMAQKPAFDPLFQALGGIMSAQGADSDPVFLNFPLNDVTAAGLSALGVCLALLHREQRGVGQRVWTTLAGCSAFMQTGELVRFAGRPTAPLGGRDHPGPSALDRFYAVADGWVRLQAPDAASLVRAGLLDAEPCAGDEGLATALAAALAGRTRAAAVHQLTAAGIPATPARRLWELLQDPALAAAEAFHMYRFASGAPYFALGRFAHFSRTQQRAVLTAPGLGEHSRAVLAEAGLRLDEIDALVAQGTVVEGPPIAVRFAYYR